MTARPFPRSTGDSEEPLATQGAYVGDDHPVVEVTVANRLDETVCYLYLSPSASRMWGMDELGPDVTLPPEEEITVEVGAATTTSWRPTARGGRWPRTSPWTCGSRRR